MDWLVSMSGTSPAWDPMAALLGGPLMERWLLVWALILLTGWTFLCNWMALDVPWVGADRNLWYGLSMGVGGVGLLLLLLFPAAIGLFFWAFLIVGQGCAYTIYRNMMVAKHQRVLTAEWFANLFKQKNQRYEITLGSKENQAPVDLKWMDGPSQTHDPPEDPDFREGFDQSSVLSHGAVTRRATEFSLAPSGGDKYSVSLTIDGFASQEKPLDKPVAAHLMLWMKKMAGLDLNEYRKPQKGKAGVMVGKKKVDLLVNTRGSVAGEEMHVRVMDKSTMRRIGDLGLPAELQEKFKKIVELPRGLFIVGGPPAGGLTTTLYAMMREHDMFQYAVASVEDPIYLDVENATQQEYNNEGGKVSFAKAVQSFFRAKDPDVLMIGRSDADTMQVAAQIAERKKIYVAMECASAVEGLGKAIKAIGDGDLVTRAVIGVSCQKLVRVLCSECKVSYKPSPDALKRLNVAPERVGELYRPPTPEENPAGAKGVCQKCQGTGYFGQTGAFELLVMTDPIRKLVASGSPLKDIQTEARKDRMLYLHEQILRKVIEGVTSVQELMRVMQASSGGR